jgi:hypothetical protein
MLDLSNNKELRSQAWYSLSKVWSKGTRTGIERILMNDCNIDSEDLIHILQAMSKNLIAQ